MELIFQNQRAFLCTIADYDRIVSINRERLSVQGVMKTPKYNDHFEKTVADILLGAYPGTEIIGVEDTDTKQLLVYQFYIQPAGSSSGFLKAGQSSKQSAFGYNSGVGILFKMGFRLGESRGIFDFYLAFKINTVVPIIKLVKSSAEHFNEENRMHWLLHKIVHPNDQLDTLIEKTLLGNSFIEKKDPMVIVHATLKEQYRIEHFKDQFFLSEGTLKRYLLD